ACRGGAGVPSVVSCGGAVRSSPPCARACYDLLVDPRALIVIEAPRRLRLDELLEELGARADADVPPEARAATITVGELVDKAAESGFGFLIGILSLIAIPFFGLSTPFGLAIALVGGQMMLGRGQPWLPERARRRALSMAMLDRVAGLLARRTRWLA